ncbi:hypothetical protein QVN17_03980 [Klebsiella pneumoniae subsp. pneumoniae]|nr:hypothetical protein [Klebsiella pneumoniae]WKC52798.1 hypothetical protein QVN17_03980 [Klebsiella pneumoniae subsp. pneumoniae]
MSKEKFERTKPHVNVGKAESPVERPGFLFYLLFVGERSPE